MRPDGQRVAGDVVALKEMATRTLPPMSNQTPVRMYFRSAKQLVKSAEAYLASGDEEMAFINFYKYSTFVVSVLPKHIEYKQATVASERAEATKNFNLCMARLEELNVKLKAYYADIALQRQKKDYTSEDEELQRRFAQLGGTTDAVAPPVVSPSAIPAPGAHAPELLGPAPSAPVDLGIPASAPQTGPCAAYPAAGVPLNALSIASPYNSIPLPSLPQTDTVHQRPPPRPCAGPPGTVPQVAAPGVAGTPPYRTLYVLDDLLTKFLRVADSNTRRGIETCGILCCKIAKDALVVTHCLVPKQKGTSDTCATTNEEEQFAFLDEHDLMCCGWIHTHPTQSCFMSSVDLHTHCAYQAMLPEAIAIVLAPSSVPNYGVFTLIVPEGLETIASCRKQGFHPHPNVPLYMPNAPHVKMVKGTVTIFDQRS